MTLTKDQKFLLEKVFPKRRYESILEKYVIGLEAYLPLNLTSEQYKLLENMCDENDIYLEKLPDKLRYQDGERLFAEYNLLKEQLVDNPLLAEDVSFMKKMIGIRNEIAEGYMVLVYRTIWKKYIDFENESKMDKEDVYQIGYEALLKLIDSYSPSKTLSFEIYVRLYIMVQLIKDATRNNKGYSSYTVKNLRILNEAKGQVVKSDDKYLEKLSELTGFSEEKILFLENVEKISNSISLEELEEENIGSDISLEEDLINKTIKKNLVKLLDFLTDEEREVIKLYYGFYNDKEYTLEEIAFITSYNTKERVRQIKEKALFKLKLPIYNIHISEMATDTSLIESYIQTKKGLDIKKAIDEYEIMLLSLLPKEMLDSLLEQLSPDTKRVLSLYLGIEGKRYNISEISSKLDMHYGKVKQIVIKGLERIKLLINDKTVKRDKQIEYYNHLAQRHFNNKNKR